MWPTGGTTRPGGRNPPCPRFAIRNPYFIVVVCLIIAVVGVTSLARMPVDMFPAMNIPVVVVATFYSGMPPEQIETDITSRFERFFTLGSGIEHIESRSLPGRERDQGLLPAGHQPGFRGHHHLQPGHGAVAPPAAGHAAAGGAQVRRLEPAGLPGDVQGRGAERDAAARSGAVPGAQPDRRRSRRQRAAAVRRPLPPDHGLCRPLQAGGAPVEPDGRGALRQRRQPDSAGRRRADRAARLQHLHQQPAAHRRARSIELPIKTVGQAPVRVADIGYAKDAPRRSRPTSCAWTASARSTCRS